ncbi:MAG: acetylxylan esterase, partial [Bacilli bacterium]|nr:acetylxylan esterase [Bacilli bacterium]
RYYSRWFDPEGQNRKQMFERLAYIDVRNFASRIQSEVLFGISMADTVCPISTQYAVYNNLKCEKQLHRYPGKGHEPIHAFDDLILSFFDKKNVKSRLVYEDDAMCFQSIGEESANLIIQFQPSIAYGKHHLRRYLSLGYEVLTVSTKLNLDLSLIKNVISRLTKIKKDHEHKRIVLVAEDVQARIALYASMKLSNVYAMILQTPVGFTSKDVNYAHKIDANILLGLGGLDDEKNMKMNQAFYANLKARNQIIQYPKYGRERINAFEDQKLKFIELEKKRF